LLNSKKKKKKDCSSNMAGPRVERDISGLDAYYNFYMKPTRTLRPLPLLTLLRSSLAPALNMDAIFSERAQPQDLISSIGILAPIHLRCMRARYTGRGRGARSAQDDACMFDSDSVNEDHTTTTKIHSSLPPSPFPLPPFTARPSSSYPTPNTYIHAPPRSQIPRRRSENNSRRLGYFNSSSTIRSSFIYLRDVRPAVVEAAEDVDLRGGKVGVSG
jgi:hypothetical protein